MGRLGTTRRLLTLIGLGILALVLTLMFIYAGRDILDEVFSLDMRYVLLSFLCFLGLQLAWAIKFYILVRRRVPKARFPYVALVNMAGNFVNITTPSGRMAGEPLRASYIAKKYGSRFSTIFAAGMVDKMTFTVAMLLLLIPLMVWASLKFDMPDLLQLLLGSFILFWVVVGLVSFLLFKSLSEGRSVKWGMFLHRIIRFFLRGRMKDSSFFIERFKNGVLEFKGTFVKLSKNPLRMCLDLTFALLVHGLRFSAAYMLFIATGHSEHFLTVATVVMMAFVIGLITQLMIGVGEASMTMLYLATGVKAARAVTVSVLTQLDSYIFEIGLGYLCLILLNIIDRKDKAKGEAAIDSKTV